MYPLVGGWQGSSACGYTGNNVAKLPEYVEYILDILACNV